MYKIQPWDRCTWLELQAWEAERISWKPHTLHTNVLLLVQNTTTGFKVVNHKSINTHLSQGYYELIYIYWQLTSQSVALILSVVKHFSLFTLLDWALFLSHFVDGTLECPTWYSDRHIVYINIPMPCKGLRHGRYIKPVTHSWIGMDKKSNRRKPSASGLLHNMGVQRREGFQELGFAPVLSFLLLILLTWNLTHPDLPPP